MSRDVRRGVRRVVGPEHPERIHGLPPARLELGGHLRLGASLLVGPLDDVVVDVGDVRDVVDGQPARRGGSAGARRRPGCSAHGRCGAGRRRSARTRTGTPRPRSGARPGARCPLRCREGAAPGYGNPIMSTPVTGTPTRPREADPRRPRGSLGRRVGRRGHLPLRRAGHPRRGLLHRHPAPDRVGSLHMGSVFGYVQTDAIARFRRMRGWKLFYPWAGTTTGCPPSAGSRPTSGCAATRRSPTTPTSPARQSRARRRSRSAGPTSSRSATSSPPEDERAFEELWRRIGLSVDWSLGYATIDDRSRRTSQRMFLHNLARGEAYSSEAPTMWDVDYQTAVAQAEMEDRELHGRLPPAAFRRHRDRDHATRARGGMRRPGGPSRRRRATRTASAPRCTRLSSGWRCRCWPTAWPSRTRGRASP